MFKKLKSNQKGFTIIEVLIVLAIAGLIMLIVFLAIPALQRNQRNNARNSEASRMSSAITECLANRNGSTGVTGNGCGVAANIQFGDTQRLSTLEYTATEVPEGSVDGAEYRFGYKCDAEGAGAEVGTNSRAFALVYKLEPDVSRCIGSE